MVKENYWPNFTTNVMIFHSELLTFLSSVATYLQHLHIEFSYHSSYVMPEITVTIQTFCNTVDFLQLGFWNRVMLLQDWSNHCRSLMANIMSAWIIMVYPSATWKQVLSCVLPDHSTQRLSCPTWSPLYPTLKLSCVLPDLHCTQHSSWVVSYLISIVLDIEVELCPTWSPLY